MHALLLNKRKTCLSLRETHTFLYLKRPYTTEFRKQTQPSRLTILIDKIEQLQSLVKSSVLIKRTTNFGTLIFKVNLKTDAKTILPHRHFKENMSRIDPKCYNYTSYKVLSWDNKKR